MGFVSARGLVSIALGLFRNRAESQEMMINASRN
jgi:hypothetical protein